MRRSGVKDCISPCEVADHTDPPVRFDWPRTDLEVASFELLIGLVYVTDPPIDSDDWRSRAGTHRVDQLQEKLFPLAKWFSLDASDGPRFMQDMEPLSESPLPLSRLFIDSPGENTEKNNTDLFVKRSDDVVFCQALAAISLYTMQAFAPGGGSGNRTSMRGGGPMVTLIEPHPDATLMEVIWANVPTGKPLPLDNAREIARTFPWTAPTPELKGGLQIHETHDHGDRPHWGGFFGMPRRIRLNFSETPARCSVTGVVDTQPVTGFVQRKLGIDYGLWRHPTSPYYRQKAESEALPVHPKPGTFGYQHYLGILLSDNKAKLRDRALCVVAYIESHNLSDENTRILVAGWAMKKGSAQDFIYSRQPAPVSELTSDAENNLTACIKAAGLMVSDLGIALSNSLTIKADKKGTGTGAVTLAKRRFYSDTTKPFHETSMALSESGDWAIIATKWRSALLNTALSIFDQLTRPHIINAKPELAANILASRKLILSAGAGYSKSGKHICDLLDLEAPIPKKKNSKKKEAGNAI